MGWLDRILGRRGDPAETASPVEPGASLVEVELYDAVDGWRTMELEISAARVSDALNDGSGPALDDVIFVVPPAEPSGDPSRRLHRPTHQIWVRAGDWAVTGQLHLPPGSAGSAYLLRRTHQFFVLTDVILSRPVADGREERRVPVLLVNLLQVSSLRDTPEPDVVASPDPIQPA